MSLVTQIQSAVTRIANEIKAVRTEKVSGGNNVRTIWRGTQAEYDAIGTKVASTVYLITA